MKCCLAFVVVAASCAVALPAASQGEDREQVEAFATVHTPSAELRAGPGLQYRVVHRADRGEHFLIQGRELSGYWLRVYLEDGRTAYLLGDTAEVKELSEQEQAAARPGVFSAPLLADAWGGLTLSGGVFDGAGYVEVRPSFVLNPSLAVEPYVGLALDRAGRRIVYGAAGTLQVAPDWAVSPYLLLGAGGYASVPNQDAFVLDDAALFHARAGGGLLVSLRLGISFRVEATHTVLFDASQYQPTQSITGGVGSYF